MESNNWRPAQGDPQAMEAPSADWRLQLQPEARQRIVNKIMDTLRRHLPVPVPEGMNELKKIAVRFEEKIYTAAVNQSDYLRKISLKMLSMETKTQQAAPMNPQSVIQNSTDSASLGLTPQVNSQGQAMPSLPMASQPPGRQQLLSQNLQNNTSNSIQGSSNLSASPNITGLSQSPLPSFGQTSNLQNMPGISHNSANNSLGQGTTPDIYTAQRQMQGRQQQQSMLSQQQQQQSQNSLLYQNQLQPQLMKQKMHNNALLQAPIQQQQQQQYLLQANQLQPSQQPIMQMSGGLPSGNSTIQQSQPTTIQSAPQSSLQQNQLNSIQQSVPFARQSQQAQSSMHSQTSLQQQSASMQQQQQQLMAQQANMSNMQNIQQSQLLGQQNIPEMKPQQQQRLPVQQNNLLNMQQSQQLLNQQTMSLHQQQPPQSQSQQQQPQLLGSLPNVSNIQPHQRSMQLLQQTKNISQSQQQIQQPSMALLQSQAQQSHHQSSQQQLISQFQPQSGQLQQQLTMQQQPNSMQREMQQRLQGPGALLQSQNAMEQQKQFTQAQRGIPEVSSSTSMDSTAQTGQTGADWQEEVYQKIQAMKEAHFTELQEFHLKIAQKIQQHEALMPHVTQTETYEKLKSFKQLLDRMILFLQIPKNNISIALKDKLPLYEKQIVSMLSSNRRQKVMPSQQQGQQQYQHPGGNAQNIPPHQPSQVLQVQQNDNHANQVQQMSMPGSVTSIPSAAASNMQHGSMPLQNLAAPAAQNIMNSVQSASNLDRVHLNSLGSLQHGSMGSVQQSGLGSLQNSVSAAQQGSINNLSQSSMNSLQPNASSMQNSNTLQQQRLKQQQQEQMMQNQQLKQQLQQRQMQQQLLQQQQRQQLLQSQQPLQQQLHQQKQQQASQLPIHQMPQIQQMNELSELKARQGSGIKPGLYQQQYPGGQRHNYYHQQLKSGTSFPISSPQNLQATSPQISHHSSPQIEHNLLPSLTKTGTPVQSTGSPFVVPSPSTPIPPSPIQGDSEKQVSAIMSLPNAGQAAHQQAGSLPPQTHSLAVVTPGISASPLLAEFSSPDVNLPNVTTTKTSASERPIERLLKAVQSLSHKTLSSAISDIGSVVSMVDRIAGSAPGNGSRAAVGDDLVATTKCRLQARNLMSQDGGATSKKMKRHTSAMPLNNVSSAGSVNDNFMQFSSLDSFEFESTATSRIKRHKVEVNHALQQEIREINRRLIDTVVGIGDEDSDSIVAASERGDGTIIKFSFSAVSLSPSLKAQFASKQMSPITPLRLLVPDNYPNCSPILLDKVPVETSKEFDDLSIKAKSKFSVSLRSLSQPMSLGEMARTWDACARKVIVEYAQQMGGGSFSSTYGTWENCVGA